MESSTWGNTQIERKVGGIVCWLAGHEIPPGLKLDADGNMVLCCRRCKIDWTERG